MTPEGLAKSADESVSEVLERRAARLRERLVDAMDEEPFFIAELTLGGTVYALPLADLLGVVPVRAVVPVPLAPPHVLGVVRFRGEMVTAMSLAWLLGAPGWRRDPSVLLVMAPGPGRRLAVDCEEVPKPVALPVSAWKALAPAIEGETGPPTVPWTTREGRTLQIVRLAMLLERHLTAGGRGG